MAGRYLASALLSAVIIAGCGSGETVRESVTEKTAAVDQAYRRVLAERKVMDTPAERVAITRDFLAEYPSSRHTADAVDAVYWYQGTELDDKEGALRYAEEIRGRIVDAEVATEVDKLLVGYYGEAAMADKMIEVADRLAEAGALDFGAQWNVIEGATKAEDWGLAREYCGSARKMANAEALKAEYPDRSFSAEELVLAVDDRVGKLLVKDGWARANLGEIREALDDFAEADRLVPRYYFDVPEYDLNVYWARTLMMSGDFEKAVERLAMQALVLRNKEALAALKRAYSGMRGGDAGYDAYADSLHHSVARTIEDFEMTDYQGGRLRFSNLRGDVTLLTFWFPT